MREHRWALAEDRGRGMGVNQLELSLIGGFHARYEGTDIEVPSLKGRAVLALLALEPTGAMSRERLRAALWSDFPSKKAQNNLRYCLWVLKAALEKAGFDGFTANREAVSISAGAARVDVIEILESVDAVEIDMRLRDDPELFDATFYGFEDLDPSFSEWLYAERARFRRQTMERLQRRLANGGDTPRHARAVADLIIAYDPLHEPSWQTRIATLAEEGDVASALGAYQAFWHDLEAEFGQEPSQRTQSLIVSIKTEAENEAGSLTVLEGADAALEISWPHIFIEPADATLAPVSHRHMIHGFRDDLITSLIRFREWRVVDCQTPSSDYYDRTKLRRAHRLVISSYDAGDAVRLLVRLIDAYTGVGIWSERFTFDVDSWGAAQNDIVRRLAVALNVHLTLTRVESIHRRPDAALEAYDKWLRAEELYCVSETSRWRRAKSLLDDVLAHHPNFARGHCTRAQMENSRHITFPGVYSTPESRSRALHHAKEAVRIDPLDSRSQLCFGWSCAVSRQWDRSELAFEIAYQNNENDPWTLVSVAVGLAFCDQTARSRDLADQALAIEFSPSPLHWAYQAVIRFLAGDYAATVRACDLSEDSAIDTPAWRAAALVQLGAHEEAQAEIDALVDTMTSRWSGAEPASRDAIARWLVDCYPIRNPSTWSRFYEGLEAAGLVVASRSLSVS